MAAEPAGQFPSVVACTVASRGELTLVRRLTASYQRHHPEHGVVVLVTDSRGRDTVPGARVVGADWLGIDSDEYLRMATAGTAAELADALRPMLVARLLDRHRTVVALAPQVLVLAPLKLPAGELLLVPRLLEPLPVDGYRPDAVEGFDSGLVAVRGGAADFVEFWLDRARARLLGTGPFAGGARSLSDWLGPDVARFNPTILRDPGLGLGYWNLHEREIAADGDAGLTVAGSPIRYVHLAGFDPDRPWLLSTECTQRPRVMLSAQPGLRRLCASYAEQLLTESDRTDAEYAFAGLPDGTELTPLLRDVFRAAWRACEDNEQSTIPFEHAMPTTPPHPFGPDHGAAFIHWLSTPATRQQRVAGLNRLLAGLRERRIDLQVAFPDPALGYPDWCRTHGVSEHLVPEWALPGDPEPLIEPVDEFGVNIGGYLTAELGLGEMGRIVHNAVRHAGVPVVSAVEDDSLSGRVRLGLEAPETVGEPRFPVSILAVNPDHTALLLRSHPSLCHDRYRIGLWAWELEDFPEAQRVGYPLVDEIWTVSEFARAAIAAHTDLPVKVFPVPMTDPGPAHRAQRRPGAPTVFLFAFDFSSTEGRKNPRGLVTAFQRAFPDRTDVRLVIKATNAHLHLDAAERLRLLVAEDDRIELLERYLTPAELGELYARCDAYVSLHRSEGFGLTVAEAMVRGIPVVVTDYSSTAEFVDERFGWPIPHTMVDVGPGWPPYQADASWADPDLTAAAATLRAVADDSAEAARRGAAAREHLLASRSLDLAADWVRGQLTEAYQRWREARLDRLEPAEPPEPTEPVQPTPPPRRLDRRIRWLAGQLGANRIAAGLSRGEPAEDDQ